ncbi:amidohydrolase family protein [Acidocella sp.]|uniref:amidohydrolase family protein n=1 Tax=Acidocella sp. TaxID=50710 RepID=UPI003D05A601
MKIAKAKWIVCGVHDRHTPEIVEDGAILHQDGIIRQIGNAAEILAENPGAEILGSDDQIILPGFVNSHHHVGLTPLQLGSPDHALELWFASRLSARTVERYLDTLYSAFEMISSGITTVQHLHGWTPGPIEEIFGTAQQILKAYRDIGMRASYSYAVRDQNLFVYDSDEALLATLPEGLSARMAAFLKPKQISLSDHLKLYDMLVDANAGQSLTRIQLAPANLHWCSDTALSEIVSRSQRDRAPMHMHLLETPYQREYARRRTGTTAVRHLEKLGLLSPRLTLGHAVWLTEEDIDLVAHTGVCVCHNCSSNFRLRSGLAPLNLYEKKNVRLAVGIDEAGLNDDRDMLQEMRLILRAHRTPGMDDMPPTCPQVLRMVTEDGALTTPFGGQIGRLAPGRYADFVVINHKRAFYPYQDDLIPVLDAIIQRAKTSAVDATIINGQTVYEQGRFVNIDRDKVLAEIEEMLSRPRTDAERGLITLSEGMQDYVRRFYDGYFTAPENSQYYRLSSKS